MVESTPETQASLFSLDTSHTTALTCSTTSTVCIKAMSTRSLTPTEGFAASLLQHNPSRLTSLRYKKISVSGVVQKILLWPS